MIAHEAYPVFGIGASAGGLEAMIALFDAKPALNGAAVIVVQHLHPKGESHLVGLLSRHTSLPVRVAHDGLAIEPDHVYVCVPNRDLVVAEGCLRLIDPESERSQRRPIDRFFESLATAYGDRAVAVVLSGTGSDGSRGISAIKASGGMVIVQDPETAAFDGMPRSAIGTGLSDLTLPVERIPVVLARLSIAPVGSAEDAEGVGESVVEPAELASVLGVLRDRFDYDFSDYKRPTLLRRSQRRMSLRSVESLEAYAKLLRDDAEEAASLFRDLMITVSGFFRDREAWEELERSVIDPLISKRENGDEIRVWSAGCATGEEAYTIGMLLLERIEASGKRIRPRIFATDVSDSLDAARAGVYADPVVSALSPERLDRFFVRRESSYEVKKHLRELIVFARHNVISDPPFSRLDLVCCRNLLIYIEPESQGRVLRNFNFALRDGGALFLGSAETVGALTDLFEPISARWRVFRSRRVARFHLHDVPRFTMTDRWFAASVARRSGRPIKDEYLALAHRALLDRYAPPSVVIDANHQVLVYHGDTSRYLSQPSGEPTRDVLALVAPGLRPPLRHAIAEALGEKSGSVTTSGYVKEDGVRRAVGLTVRTLDQPPDQPPMVLVSFEERAEPSVVAEREPESGGGSSITVDQIEDELRLARRDLREVSEQYDRLVEEYSTSNEEMLSINEELQSANEELETSKEELQSLNEELSTLNSELRSKVDTVEQANNDLNNLLASTHIATLFLDRSARIRWFTPASRKLLRLIPTDVGRPISDIASTVTGSTLETLARQVLETLLPVEAEVEAEHGRWYLRRMLPYRTSDSRIDGVVVTFIDITDRRLAEEQRELMMHELSHRIKNTLTTVQAIVGGLGRGCKTLPEFLRAIEPRLFALARAQTVYSLPGVSRIGLRLLLDRELAPYVGGYSSRVTVAGEELFLRAEPAMALELIFHELVTNAVKYGALSNDAGTVLVRCGRSERADGLWARIEWVESGGPPVSTVGEIGFGSSLIERSVQHDLAGTVSLQFPPSGLDCVIEFPLEDGAGARDGERSRKGDSTDAERA
ncbi:MAG TPA: chemotaxis protein CheB [Phycisphaerales bacterium]|nr:chemotaxis protein CheB [Phycisphaerales bacterium]